MVLKRHGCDSPPPQKKLGGNIRVFEMFDRSSGTFGNGQITAGSFRKTGQEVFEIIAQNQRSLEPGAKPLPGIRAVP